MEKGEAGVVGGTALRLESGTPHVINLLSIRFWYGWEKQNNGRRTNATTATAKNNRKLKTTVNRN